MSQEYLSSKWTLRLRDIQYFSNVLYPRILSQIWMHGIKPAYLRAGKNMEALIINVLNGYLNNIGTATQEELKTRGIIDSFLHFITNSREGVNLIDGYNFEYVIHNGGIDLPLVQKPKHRSEVFLQFRDRPLPVMASNLPKFDDELNIINTVDPALLDKEFWHKAVGEEGIISNNRIQALESGNAIGEVDARIIRDEGVYGQWPEDDQMHDIDTYMATMVFQGRPWQIRQTVLSSLHGAIPRLVANLWYENTLIKEVYRQCEENRSRDDLTFSEGDSSKRSFLLQERLKGPEANKVMKEFLANYLEKPLRGPFLGKFEVQPVLLQSQEEMGGIWLNERGILIKIPQEPDMDQIYTQIAEGKSGNPVFTSTHPTTSAA